MTRALLLVQLLAFAVDASGHQPVVDMAPRWNDGYGIQTRVERARATTTTWLEGVYTFKPALRTTLKLPFSDGKLGDAIFAMPLKNYTNRAAFTSNWGVTPALKIPTGGGSAWDAGLGLSYSSETPYLYQFYDVYTLGSSTGVDINVGTVHPDGNGSSWFTLWDVTMLKNRSGRSLHSGPVLVYFKRNIAARLEYKFELYENIQGSVGNSLGFTLGFVY